MEVSTDHIFEGGNPKRVIVQTRDKSKLSATGLEELLSASQANLLECFQAIGDEGRAN